MIIETPPVGEHLRHMTDGRWHDNCTYCLRRRAKGGTGVPAAEMATYEAGQDPATTAAEKRAEREAAELTDIAYDRTHPDPYRNWVNGEQPAPGTENQP